LFSYALFDSHSRLLNKLFCNKKWNNEVEYRIPDYVIKNDKQQNFKSPQRKQRFETIIPDYINAVKDVVFVESEKRGLL